MTIPFVVQSTLPETKKTLKIDGWKKNILSFWEGLFSGAMFVSGRVVVPSNFKGFLSLSQID